ncbi:hypothetical protein ABB37_04713 [Leptomonas pyrrhocoris]|uniref:DNA-directed RNA polymerase III subunit RPC6 n=1 Tax=Leptomonas pyrrhocoris TaxID=157538 RepID=A0A0M9G1V7_LEPPY|nr:hypothetical protein ABB37_04713 [Leptomonas pyrrhocoris]XP_015658936.1 hypothetical protein ABB37_04713 [Leptomonas pyrrhocoris]KPA80496.1 hypothetical protein ABB37_04713 [Leptomonas pyrrhocoris]KPA80497.1 hypothetical protein ABB37_04713 [Leptomonas pyrrhocoris]|eukprot:XP_015658935.1 hypothetical protein ABB37_04713 [Leptomonas pyrrhocoris]
MASSSSSSAAAVEQRLLHRLSTAAEEAVPYERLKRELNLGANGGEGVIRQLVEQNRLRLRRGGGGDSQIYVSIVNNINGSLSLVMDAVRASGESGIDQTQLQNKVRMPKTELGKALAALAAKGLIKEHRSFTNRAKRIYTLFHVDPSAHVTGGTMYCGENLDTAFVDEWRRELTRFISTRRMVGFDQIKRHVEAVQSASSGGSASTSAQVGGGGGGGGSGGTSPMTPLVVTMIDSAYTRPVAAPIHPSAGAAGGVGHPNSTSDVSGVANAAFASKQLSEIDLRTLVQTLVLDGVLELRVPDSQEEVSAPQYQIACGQGVMRHFTVQARRRQQQQQQQQRGASGVDGSPPRQRLRRDSCEAAAGAAGTSSSCANLLLDIESDSVVSTMDALRQTSLWEPAPVSQPSAQEAVDGWSYMPALGFPCLGCPQLERCSVSGYGVVNPKSCAYLKEWLS